MRVDRHAVELSGSIHHPRTDATTQSRVVAARSNGSGFAAGAPGVLRRAPVSMIANVPLYMYFKTATP